jgi:hypothetical protein
MLLSVLVQVSPRPRGKVALVALVVLLVAVGAGVLGEALLGDVLAADLAQDLKKNYEKL